MTAKAPAELSSTQEFSSTSEIVADADLALRELVALEAMRSINDVAALICKSQPRKIFAGMSDAMSAWTDGRTYVAFDRKQLAAAGMAPPTGLFRLVHLLIHEYTHTEVSRGDHIHEDAFYLDFHTAILSLDMHDLLESAYKAHVRSMIKHSMVAPKRTRAFVTWCASNADKLPTSESKSTTDHGRKD